MADVEREIAARLKAEADQVQPSPLLADRVLAGVRVRRRRRRTTELVGAVAAVAVAVAAPTAVHLAGHRDHSPKLTAVTTRPPNLDLTLDQVHTVSRRLPGGRVFTAFGIGADGSVVGQSSAAAPTPRPPTSDPGDTYSTLSSGTVWRSAPGSDAPTPMAATFARPSVRTDGKRVVWPENRDDDYDFQLMCAAPGGRGRQISTTGVAGRDSAFAADNGTVVWSDDDDRADTVWADSSCDAAPRAVYKGGAAVAFTYPDVLVVDTKSSGEFADRLNAVNVESGASRALPLRGATVSGQDDSAFAANKQVVAWADGKALTVLDRLTGRPSATTRLPDAKSANTERLTAGNKVLVYSAQTGDGPDTAHSLVYDLRTATSTALPGDAYAAGDWLLWRDGDAYHIGRIR